VLDAEATDRAARGHNSHNASLAFAAQHGPPDPLEGYRLIKDQVALVGPTAHLDRIGGGSHADRLADLGKLAACADYQGACMQ